MNTTHNHPRSRVNGHATSSRSKPSPHGLAYVLDGLVLDARLPTAAAESVLGERMAQRARCTATPVSQTVDTSPRRRPPSTAACNRARARRRLMSS